MTQNTWPEMPATFTEQEIITIKKLMKKKLVTTSEETTRRQQTPISTQDEIKRVIDTLDQYCKDQKIENEYAVEAAVTKFITKYENRPVM